MKTKKNILLLFVSLFFITFSINAQETALIKLRLNKSENEKRIAVNDKGEKTITFKISGLTSQDDVDQFVKKVKTIKGVVEFNISNVSTSDEREGSAVFFSGAKKYYFKNFLIEAGINKLIIDNKEIEPKDIDTSRKEKK